MSTVNGVGGAGRACMMEYSYCLLAIDNFAMNSSTSLYPETVTFTVTILSVF